MDPRTGIDWSTKPDEMVARIRFAAQDGMLAGMSQIWEQQGYVDRSLMERMIAERPLRADYIRNVFRRFGVYRIVFRWHFEDILSRHKIARVG